MKLQTIQLDSKGRTSLQRFRYKDYDQYIVSRHEDGVSLILTPCRIIPISVLGGTQE